MADYVATLHIGNHLYVERIEGCDMIVLICLFR